MDEPSEVDRRIMDAIARTEVVRAPRQPLATFGVTNLYYYVVTEPVYSELLNATGESVVREGKIAAERPAVVTPFYMSNLEGFGEDARRYMEALAREFGPSSPGLLYRYKNEAGSMDVVEGTVKVVSHRINHRLSREENHSSVVIEGVDELWDVSLLKFIYGYTMASLANNLSDLRAGGLLDSDPIHGVPRAAIQQIEQLFRQVEHGADPSLLKRELDRWGLFEQYQDRFLRLFQRRR